MNVCRKDTGERLPFKRLCLNLIRVFPCTPGAEAHDTVSHNFSRYTTYTYANRVLAFDGLKQDQKLISNNSTLWDMES